MLVVVVVAAKVLLVVLVALVEVDQERLTIPLVEMAQLIQVVEAGAVEVQLAHQMVVQVALV